MKVELHQVDAFAGELFGGNPAGVVTKADGLSSELMTKIAREMNLSETAFVLMPSNANADIRLRFFTPSGDEVDFCGHASVGALFELARLDRFGLGASGKNAVRVETKAGILDMTVTNGSDDKAPGRPEIGFTAPAVDLGEYRLQGADFAKAFGVPASFIKADATVYIDRVLNYLYIPVASLKALGEQTYDFGQIRAKFGGEGIVVFCLFTEQTFDESSQLHARGLAPNVGVNEDPFTGSMQAGMVHAAQRNSMIAVAQETLVSEQGYFMDRPGSALLRYDSANGRVEIVAQATHVFSAEMEVAV